MNTVTIHFKKSFHIDPSVVDFKKNLKLSSLFSYFQDTASLAAEQLGVGIERLINKYGVTWVLARIRVNVLRYPKLDEEIFIETWPIKPNRVEFERDFQVRDKNGEIIINAISSWILMDIKERKIKRTDSVNFNYPEEITKRAINCKLGKIRSFGHLEKAYQKTIGYSDIDINGHLNNSKYIDYIMDCFSVSDHKQYDVSSIEVNFLNEALPGESIILFKDISQLNQKSIYVEGLNENTQKTTFRSKFTIKKH